MQIQISGKNFQVVRSRSAVLSAGSSSVKMKTDSIRSACLGVVSHGMKAMRQIDACAAGDMNHKAVHGAIKDAITASAMAQHDASYYNDSSAAHSVATSSAAAKAYRAAAKSVGAMNCVKCSDNMKSLSSALDYGIAVLAENAGEFNDELSATDGAFKGLFLPNTSIYRGQAIKRISANKVGGRLVCFTDEAKKDAEGEFFDKDTDFMIGVYPIKSAMSLYNHGMDRSIGSCPIGTVVSAEVKADGIHIEAEMNFLANYKSYITALEAPEKWKTKQVAMASQYDKIIKEMIDDGTLGWSSGAHSPSVAKSRNGHIDRWPIIEASATPIPAMPFETKIQPVKSLFDYAEKTALTI